MSIAEYYGEGRPSTVFYDVIEEVYRPVATELAFYRSMAPAEDCEILELGCGTGRIGWALAEAGHTVLGVDVSPAILARARSKAEFYGPQVAARVDFRQGDVCAIDLQKQFPLVIAPYRVFDHLTSEAAQMQFLANARRHLPFDGVAVFDTNHPTEDRLHTPENWVNQPPLRIELPHLGAAIERSIAASWADAATQTLTTDFCYRLCHANGVIDNYVDRLVVRWQTPEQIRAMLAEAGFAVLAEYADFAKTKPAPHSEDRVWAVRLRKA